jgi:hypothetical protein
MSTVIPSINEVIDEKRNVSSSPAATNISRSLTSSISLPTLPLQQPSTATIAATATTSQRSSFHTPAPHESNQTFMVLPSLHRQSMPNVHTITITDGNDDAKQPQPPSQRVISSTYSPCTSLCVLCDIADCAACVYYKA